jgi:SAM-dependent methyltransferase
MDGPSFLEATRTAYDLVASDYAEAFNAELAALPLDRALLTAFAELVRGAGSVTVADLGCGPGHVTAYLHSQGLHAFGVDLSPEMVALARREHPGLRFDEGTMTDLDIANGTLAGVVAMYSIIHVPPPQLPTVFAEFRRILAPGGHTLVAFQVGDDALLHRTEWFGRTIALDRYWLKPDRVADLLVRAGFEIRARMLREPDGPTEKVQRAYLLARALEHEPVTASG